MNREIISSALSGIDEKYLIECAEDSFARAKQEKRKENRMSGKGRVRLLNARRAALIAAAVCLILALSVTAYAADAFVKIFGWGNNLEIRQFVDENGESAREVILYTDALTEPVRFENSRMYFIVNNEHIDITDKISQTEAFRYEYSDEEGNTHLWLVGLLSENPGHYGYAEYIKDPSGEWIGGYSARINTESDGRTEALWLETAKSELIIPW